jgi:DNA-binding transcriptional LysR family regulator
MGSRLETRQFKSIVVGADTLVPLSAPAKGGAPRWRLGKPASQSGLGRIVAAVRSKDRLALETVFTSHLAATLLSMARAGDGVAWLPRTLAEEDIAAGRLVEAGKPDLQVAIEIRLFRPAARQSAAAESAWTAFQRG